MSASVLHVYTCNEIVFISPGKTEDIPIRAANRAHRWLRTPISAGRVRYDTRCVSGRAAEGTTYVALLLAGHPDDGDERSRAVQRVLGDGPPENPSPDAPLAVEVGRSVSTSDASSSCPEATTVGAPLRSPSTWRRVGGTARVGTFS